MNTMNSDQLRTHSLAIVFAILIGAAQAQQFPIGPFPPDQWPASADPNKRMVLRGLAIMGGVEIKN